MARDLTSVLEKVELLKSVGAEELADQALLKVMQLEIDRLQQAQQRLQGELKRFENQYRTQSTPPIWKRIAPQHDAKKRASSRRWSADKNVPGTWPAVLPRC
jgi:hypothetical protein